MGRIARPHILYLCIKRHYTATSVIEICVISIYYNKDYVYTWLQFVPFYICILVILGELLNFDITYYFLFYVKKTSHKWKKGYGNLNDVI